MSCFKPYKGVSSNLLAQSLESSHARFKPYKGVSSNVVDGKTILKDLSKVSNPIREYLQI